MSQNSPIEWTDSTWNPVRGCSRVSPGCLNCYAEKVATRFSDPGQPFHLFADRFPKPHWTGKVELVESHLLDPLKWRKPKRIFVNSMSDLFHEGLSDEAIDRVFAVMALCPQHTFQILTKRSIRMLNYLSNRAKSIRYWESAARDIGYTFKFSDLDGVDYSSCPFPLPNVWMGVSAENQDAADERIPLLRQIPAAVRFVSYEPALGPVDFTRFLFTGVGGSRLNSLHWIIVGGESGPGARPFDVAWARSAVHQCRAAGVACFVKQLGSHPVTRVPGCTTGGTPWQLKDRKGGDMSEWPEDLRLRQFPSK